MCLQQIDRSSAPPQGGRRRRRGAHNGCSPEWSRLAAWSGSRYEQGSSNQLIVLELILLFRQLFRQVNESYKTGKRHAGVPISEMPRQRPACFNTRMLADVGLQNGLRIPRPPIRTHATLWNAACIARTSAARTTSAQSQGR